LSPKFGLNIDFPSDLQHISAVFAGVMIEILAGQLFELEFFVFV
jgi:hypothetical protein